MSNNNIEQIIEGLTKKQQGNGSLKILIAIGLIFLIIPMILYGLGQMGHNTIIYVGGHKERKIRNIELKNKLNALKKERKL